MAGWKVVQADEARGIVPSDGERTRRGIGAPERDP
jgi:hypothetical protein